MLRGQGLANLRVRRRSGGIRRRRVVRRVRHLFGGPTAYSAGKVDRPAAQLLLLDRARAGSAAPRLEDRAYQEADVSDAQTDIFVVYGLGLGARWPSVMGGVWLARTFGRETIPQVGTGGLQITSVDADDAITLGRVLNAWRSREHRVNSFQHGTTTMQGTLTDGLVNLCASASGGPWGMVMFTKTGEQRSAALNIIRNKVFRWFFPQFSGKNPYF
jgi:hypothetical protein